VVVDASVALKWQFRDEDDVPAALQLLDDFTCGRLRLSSPALFSYEVVNALHMAVVKGRLSHGEAIEAVKDMVALGIETIGHAGLEERTLELARLYGRSAYDCAYMATAEHLRSPLVTADKKLFNSLRGRWKPLVWIADYRSAC